MRKGKENDLTPQKSFVIIIMMGLGVVSPFS